MERGLQFVMDTPGYDAEYKKFCRAFAERLMEVAGVAPSLSTLQISKFKTLRSMPAAFPKQIIVAGTTKPIEELKSYGLSAVLPSEGK